MTYKVTYSSGNNHKISYSSGNSQKVNHYIENNYSVKLVSPTKTKVSFSYNLEIMPRYLHELYDVNITGDINQYVLMYDSASGKWRNVNPDVVISAATTEPTQPGLPQDFIDSLDIELDNKIDLDAGSF